MSIQSPPTVQTSGEIIRLSATITDLAATPDDGYRYELLKGVLLRMPPPRKSHARLVALLLRLLTPYCEANGLLDQLLADSGYELGTAGMAPIVLAPDVSIARTTNLSDTTYDSDAPLLAVEVVSPLQSRPLMQDKAELYLASGTALVWVVWPESRTVDAWTPPSTFLTRGVGESLDGGTVLPGLSIPVADIFP